MKTKAIFCLTFFMLTFALISFGQNSDQELMELRKTISLENIKELESEIEFPVGGIVVTTTTRNEVKGIFQYNEERWKPEISFRKEEKKGYLEISADREGDWDEYDDSDENVWAISLPERVVHELEIEMAAGKSKINLEGCKIKNFEFAMAAGETKINLRNTSVKDLEIDAAVGEAIVDLSGDWENDLDASITGALGEITIKLPDDIGVKLDVHGLLGEVDAPGFTKRRRTYTNDLYGKTEHTLYIDLTGGLGEINIETKE